MSGTAGARVTGPDLAWLRRGAVAATMAPSATLAAAVAALGFVQADPIRAPARAQDLILRHRVRGYRAGDLERRFRRLGLEEDFLYAYGFMPAEVARLLHPRPDPAHPEGRHAPQGLAAEVLAFVRERGATHPADLEAAFGRERALNAWGGFSKATTRALQRLHYYGLLRVAGRRDGIRLYEAAPPPAERLDPDERRRRVLRLAVGLLAPLPEGSLGPTLGLLRRGAPGLGTMRRTVEAMLRGGELEAVEAEGERWLSPAGAVAAGDAAAAARGVRFLAPFDPIVWDRRRFELLWGWPYRFEAYTPAARRRLGYYAMPLLWRDAVIGWVNLTAADGRLDVVPGFVAREPRSAAFRRAFDAEVARMADFLALR